MQFLLSRWFIYTDFILTGLFKRPFYARYPRFLVSFQKVTCGCLTFVASPRISFETEIDEACAVQAIHRLNILPFILPSPRRGTRCRRRMVMANRLWYLEREARVMEGLRGEQNHPASRTIMRDQRPVPCKCIRPSADYFLYHAPRIPSTNLLIPISTLITSLVCLDHKPSFKFSFSLPDFSSFPP